MFEHRIAVTGLTGAGKTTFITSLLDHWMNHDQSRFKLGRNAGAKMYCLPEDEDGESHKHFLEQRACFEEGRWPNKTFRNQEIRVRVKIHRPPGRWGLKTPMSTYWPWKSVCLVDIAGERFADADIMKRPEHAQWSGKCVSRLTHDRYAVEPAREFLKLYHEAVPATADKTAEELRTAYLRLAAELVKLEHPFITPSSILIDKEGNYIPSNVRQKGEDSGDAAYRRIIEHGICGLPDMPVYPLPPSLRETRIGKKIAGNYQAYRKEVVLRDLAPLASCRDLLVLVDVASVLKLGPQWKNASSQMAKSIIDAASPQGLVMRNLKRSLRLATGGWTNDYVRRVWFVATKCDRVSPDQHDRLKGLLDSLMIGATRRHVADQRFSIDTFVTSAVNCVRHENGRCFYRERDLEGNDKSRELKRVDLPKEWPDDWKGSDFSFPNPTVVMPKNRGNPPNQNGMNYLTEMLFDIRA